MGYIPYIVYSCIRLPSCGQRKNSLNIRELGRDIQQICVLSSPMYRVPLGRGCPKDDYFCLFRCHEIVTGEFEYKS